MSSTYLESRPLSTHSSTLLHSVSRRVLLANTRADARYGPLLSTIWARSSRPSPISQPPRQDSRDNLVRRLRQLRSANAARAEREATRKLLLSKSSGDRAPLARLWGVPVASLSSSSLFEMPPGKLMRFYRRNLERDTCDGRLYKILGGTACGVPRDSVANLIRTVLATRRSPLYDDHMDLAVEVALFALAPDRYAPRISLHAFRAARLCGTIRMYEHSASFTGAFAGLQAAKFVLLLQDLARVRGEEPGSVGVRRPNRKERGGANGNINGKAVKKRFRSCGGTQSVITESDVKQYCAERELLTARAIRGVFGRHVGSGRGSNNNNGCKKMSDVEFVRLFLALVDCTSDSGIRYWFGVLDADGDGTVGREDVFHFYTERKSESEKRNGLILTQVQGVWQRIIGAAMRSGSKCENGVTLADVRAMSKDDREFMMCALLIRRANDGNLIDVKATLKADKTFKI